MEKMSNVEVERSIEAILMVVDEPVTEIVLAQILEKSVEEIESSLGRLISSYDDRGFSLKKINGGGDFTATLSTSASLKSSFSMDNSPDSLKQLWRPLPWWHIGSPSPGHVFQLSVVSTWRLS